jgi:DMSO reductase family type II enzyme heme b subunit
MILSKRAKSCALFLALAVFGASRALAQEPVLEATRVVGVHGPLLDLQASYWRGAPTVKVEMQPQVFATPMNAAPAVAELQVKAVYSDHWFAFLIEWQDATKSDVLRVDQFGDQVAVQMPMTYQKDMQPNPMMGAPGERVMILQWRAAFQRDIDVGDHNLRALYPNAHSDVYPDEVLRVTDARAYAGAVGLDNPISHPKRSPVLDQMAEGFGSMTVKAEQHADGKGVWRDGRWRVVISHPLATAAGGNAPRLKAGDETLVAFAVWEGGAREVGARKAWSNWLTLRLAQ